MVNSYPQQKPYYNFVYYAVVPQSQTINWGVLILRLITNPVGGNGIGSYLTPFVYTCELVSVLILLVDFVLPAPTNCCWVSKSVLVLQLKEYLCGTWPAENDIIISCKGHYLK